MTNAEITLARHEERITQIVRCIDNQNDRMEKIEGKIEKIETKIDRIQWLLVTTLVLLVVNLFVRI